MPDTIESVESEGCRQHDLGGILDCLRKSGDDLQYMGRVESSGSSKVCQKVAVHHCDELGTEDGGSRIVLTNTEANTSDSIGDRGEPCQLGLIDGEVRR